MPVKRFISLKTNYEGQRSFVPHLIIGVVIRKLIAIVSLVTVFLLVQYLNISSLSYSGRIDETFLEKLDANNKLGMPITLDSFGGNAEIGFRSALNIRANENTIIVENRCFSACSEDILPAAKTIVFKNSPMIGFHWNSFMNREQMIRYGGNTENCSNDGINRQRVIYAFQNLNEDFWMHTEERLNLTSFEVVHLGNNCPRKIREFSNHLWLPSSNQLKDMWGLEFSGAVCSDNLTACKAKVSKFLPKGFRVVIEDEVFIVE